MACASGVTSAPLNPAYRADEFEFYLSDLNAKALIVEQASTSPAIEVAVKLGVRLIDLVVAEGAPAGAFTLVPREAQSAGPAATRAMPSPTTCRCGCTPRAPPRGPRSCRCRSAMSGGLGHATSLRHTAASRAADLRPQHHAAVPYPWPDGRPAGAVFGWLAASSAAPGFNALQASSAWMQEAKPTWYTAVPTMHQTIVGARCPTTRTIIARQSAALRCDPPRRRCRRR